MLVRLYTCNARELCPQILNYSFSSLSLSISPTLYPTLSSMTFGLSVSFKCPLWNKYVQDPMDSRISVRENTRSSHRQIIIESSYGLTLV